MVVAHAWSDLVRDRMTLRSSIVQIAVLVDRSLGRLKRRLSGRQHARDELGVRLRWRNNGTGLRLRFDDGVPGSTCRSGRQAARPAGFEPCVRSALALFSRSSMRVFGRLVELEVVPAGVADVERPAPRRRSRTAGTRTTGRDVDALRQRLVPGVNERDGVVAVVLERGVSAGRPRSACCRCTPGRSGTFDSMTNRRSTHPEAAKPARAMASSRVRPSVMRGPLQPDRIDTLVSGSDNQPEGGKVNPTRHRVGRDFRGRGTAAGDGVGWSW